MVNDSHAHKDVAAVETASKTTLRRLLKVALDQEHVWPAFQPIVDMRTGAIASFEILARWRNPRGGEFNPAVFVPRLEQCGLIGVLSQALMARACCAAADWPGEFSLAFNISPIQLIDEDFPRQLVSLAKTTGFPLNRVELEVTEASLITDDDRAFRILEDVNGLGVRVGIDDFGTGHSSLARLEAFPFHKLKIDALFVRNLDSEAGKRRIAAATIGLGQSLGIIVVAEGIETAAEDSILRSLGCDLGQGWFYGKGEQAAQARHVLETRGSATTRPHPLDASPFQQLHQLANLYDKAPVGLCFVDMDLRHVRTNDQFASIHGMTGAEIEGKKVSDIMDGEILQTVVSVLADVARTDQPIPQDYVLRDRDLRLIAARVKDLAGEILGFSVVAIDITDENRLKATLAESECRRRQLQERTTVLEAMLLASPDGILLEDRDGQKVAQNKRLNELWNIPENVAAIPDIRTQLAFCISQVTNPAAFEEKIAQLQAHHDDVSIDDVELVDGTRLNYHRMALRDAEGCYCGRVWAFRKVV